MMEKRAPSGKLAQPGYVNEQGRGGFSKAWACVGGGRETTKAKKKSVRSGRGWPPVLKETGVAVKRKTQPRIYKRKGKNRPGLRKDRWQNQKTLRSAGRECREFIRKAPPVSRGEKNTTREERMNSRNRSCHELSRKKDWCPSGGGEFPLERGEEGVAER